MFGRATCGCAITGCSSAPAIAPGGFPSCSASLSDMLSPFCTLNELLSVCTNFFFLFDHDVLSKIHPTSDTMSSHSRDNSVHVFIKLPCLIPLLYSSSAHA